MTEITLESQLFDIINDKDMPERIKLAKLDMLQSLGVDFNAKKYGKSALIFANEMGVKSVSDFLSKNGAIEEIISEEEAIKLGQKLIEECGKVTLDINNIKSLIEEGANVNVKNRFGRTALNEVASRSNADIVKLLISIGADIK